MGKRMKRRMGDVLAGIQAIVMEALLIAFVFVPLIAVKMALLAMRLFPRMPETGSKPRWIDRMATATSRFYKDYLSF